MSAATLDELLARAPIAVSLGWDQVLAGAYVGLRRHIGALMRGCDERYGSDGSFDLHIWGACGERAFCKALNIDWPAKVNTFNREPDINPDIEIKLRRVDWYELLVRPSDKDDRRYVLVTGIINATGMHFIVHGWMYGWDAKRPGWLKEHGGRPPAYFVPHDQLRDVLALGL